MYYERKKNKGERSKKQCFSFFPDVSYHRRSDFFAAGGNPTFRNPYPEEYHNQQQQQQQQQQALKAPKAVGSSSLSDRLTRTFAGLSKSLAHSSFYKRASSSLKSLTSRAGSSSSSSSPHLVAPATAAEEEQLLQLQS